MLFSPTRQDEEPVSYWTTQQEHVVRRLAESLARLQERRVDQSQVVQAVREKLDEFDGLAKQSSDFRQRVDNRIATLREQLDLALTQIDSWGIWLASQSNKSAESVTANQRLDTEVQSLSKERTELELEGKVLLGRLNLLDQAKQFLASHWIARHSNTCPVCDSDVTERHGIETVISVLQDETTSSIQTLRANQAEIQKRQKELDSKLKTVGSSSCPVAADDQVRLNELLRPFLHSQRVAFEEWLIDSQKRGQLKNDITRMRIFPEAPKPYANAALEAERLASDFIALTQEADRALEDPQSIGEIKTMFEQTMEKVLIDHLPSTLGKVWQEITLTLTTASWLLPDQPALRLEQRGKFLSIQAGKSGRFVRYLYNAAERHVLGLAWFFTYYLAKRRFEEAWILLDDPAQEMDQPSFRELVRFWETLLRLHKKASRPFTMIIALHQEERALDATRATNGRLYILGWQREQDRPSVKKVVLLAPGFHPLKPEKIFG